MAGGSGVVAACQIGLALVVDMVVAQGRGKSPCADADFVLYVKTVLLLLAGRHVVGLEAAVVEIGVVLPTLVVHHHFAYVAVGL